jgi:peroxiredoxin
MRTRIVAAVLGLLICASYATAQEAQEKKEAPKELKVGDVAPDFAWPKPDRAEGSSDTVRLSDIKGKQNVLIAFYPKVFTGGCTKQLCGYRDDFSKFKAAETEIVAISVDPQTESDRFRTEMKMPFAVLGDAEHKVIDAYGIPLKEHNGNSYAQRAVILVDRDGKIAYMDMDYQIGSDEKPLFEAMKKLAPPAEEGAKQS